LSILEAVLVLFLGTFSAQPQQQESEAVALKPIKTVYPVYPEHLKKEGIAGEVIIQVWIDELGNVKTPGRPNHIMRSLHPELDKLATEAVQDWEYTPPLIQGKPRGVWTYISIIFDPGELPEVEDPASQEPTSDELRAILDRSWEYCRKMDEIAHFYLCRERISETIRSIVNVGPSMMGSFGDEFKSIFKVRSFIPDLSNPNRNRYVNDYQVTSKNNLVTELRTPIKPALEERDSQFGEKIISFPMPVSIPSRLLAPGFRQEYIFLLKDEKRTFGKACYILEINSRKRRGIQIKKATIWIEKEDFRVIKAEVMLDASAIDERIRAECREFYLVPHMTVTYEYRVEEKGLLFPSRSEVVLDYSQLGRTNTRDTKMKVDIQYDKYRFFTVETESKIIRTSR
jgi:protein TonB